MDYYVDQEKGSDETGVGTDKFPFRTVPRCLKEISLNRNADESRLFLTPGDHVLEDGRTLNAAQAGKATDLFLWVREEE